MGVRGAWSLAATVVGCALYVGAVLWEPGRRVDIEWFARAQELVGGDLDPGLPFVARRVLPAALLVVVAALSLWFVRRRGWPLVLVLGAAVVVTALLARSLRELLPRPVGGQAYGYVDNTFPSTHGAVATALALTVWTLVGPRGWWRLLCAVPLLGIVVVAALGNVVGHAHRPADVLGGALLAAAVVGAAPAIGKCRGGKPAEVEEARA